MAAYATRITVPWPLEETVRRVTDELRQEGFGLLTEIDVAATLKQKLDLDRRPYRILGACHPHTGHQALAHQAIDAEPDVGLLLPCNVVVRVEADGSTTVAFMEPRVVLGVTGRRDLLPLGERAFASLERVRAALQG